MFVSIRRSPSVLLRAAPAGYTDSWTHLNLHPGEAITDRTGSSLAGRAEHLPQLRVPGLRTIRVTRYVTPLREGGSLPAIVEGDDDGLYVLKFRGAGQGARALIAELVSGEIARALGLPYRKLSSRTSSPTSRGPSPTRKSTRSFSTAAA
jgi:hypothetical protein